MRLTAAVTVVVAAAMTAAALWHGATVVTYPYQVEYSEGIVLGVAWRAAQGLTMYPEVGQPPFIVTNYTPLVPWLVSLTQDVAEPSFFPGRLLSFAALLAVASLVGVWAGKLAGHWGAGILAGMLFLRAPQLVATAGLHRVDPLGAAFELTGIVLWLHRKRSGRAIPWEALAFALAFLCKQTFLLGAGAVVLAELWLLFRRHQQIGSSLPSLAWIPVVAAAYGWLALVTDGRIITHTVELSALSIQANKNLEGLLRLVTDLAPLAPLLLAGVYTRLRESGKRAPASSPELIIALAYSAASFAFYAYAVGKPGAWEGYALQPVAGLSVLAGGLVWPVINRAATSPIASATAALCIAAMLGTGFIPGVSDYPHTPTREDKLTYRMLIRELQSIPGRAAGVNTGLLLQAGKGFEMDPFDVTFLALAGRYPLEPVLERLRNGTYTLVQSDTNIGNILHPELLAVLQQHYGLIIRKEYMHYSRPGLCMVWRHAGDVAAPPPER